jgi:hypothetical protein
VAFADTAVMNRERQRAARPARLIILISIGR